MSEYLNIGEDPAAVDKIDHFLGGTIADKQLFHTFVRR